MASDSKRLIAVVGPTASGKTRLAVRVARSFAGEIISGDSRQVYRGMDIGTGKDLEEYGDIPYHLIDICDAGEKYNLYRYLKDFITARNDIESRGKTPVLCGGSGMYLEAAIKGMVMPEVPHNEDLRSSLKGKTLEELTDILSSMKTLHNVTDVDTMQRAIRAIEIQTYYKNHPEEEPGQEVCQHANTVIVGIDIPREARRERITSRLKSRLEAGMVAEVESLLKKGVSEENLIYYGLEYKWLTLYVTGKVSYEEMFKQLETSIHQFAKRQMTWFRGMEKRGLKINWIPYNIDEHELTEKVSQWLVNS